MLAVCSCCGHTWETTEEEASAPGRLCLECFLRHIHPGPIEIGYHEDRGATPIADRIEEIEESLNSIGKGQGIKIRVRPDCGKCGRKQLERMGDGVYRCPCGQEYR